MLGGSLRHCCSRLQHAACVLHVPTEGCCLGPSPKQVEDWVAGEAKPARRRLWYKAVFKHLAAQVRWGQSSRCAGTLSGAGMLLALKCRHWFPCVRNVCRTRCRFGA